MNKISTKTTRTQYRHSRGQYLYKTFSIHVRQKLYRTAYRAPCPNARLALTRWLAWSHTRIDYRYPMPPQIMAAVLKIERFGQVKLSFPIDALFLA